MVWSFKMWFKSVNSIRAKDVFSYSLLSSQSLKSGGVHNKCPWNTCLMNKWFSSPSLENPHWLLTESQDRLQPPQCRGLNALDMASFPEYFSGVPHVGHRLKPSHVHILSNSHAFLPLASNDPSSAFTNCQSSPALGSSFRDSRKSSLRSVPPAEPGAPHPPMLPSTLYFPLSVDDHVLWLFPLQTANSFRPGSASFATHSRG